MPAYKSLVILIMLVFFVISFLTNIMGSIIPDFIDSFDLSLTLAAFLPFSFFIAYGVMSIPAGIAVERFSVKSAIVFSFSIAFTGSFLFAATPAFPTAIVSLFMIGAGMATLQVALNPLLRVAGGEEQFAFNMVLVQLVFGSASYISPQVYSYLVKNLGSNARNGNIVITLLSKVVRPSMAWVSIYWLFAIISLIMLIVMMVIKIPAVRLREDERIGTMETMRVLVKNKTVILFFIGIFAYVGSEQGVANWISTFLEKYHNCDPHTTGATAVSRYWGSFTAGSLLGLALVKLIDSRKVLSGFAVAAIVILSCALFGPKWIAVFAFPTLGFFSSSMWSIVFSLGLNSIDRHHGAFSGILCTGIVGGALVPLAIGGIGDLLGLRVGMMFLYATFGYILFVGLWAKPLVTNKTIAFRRRSKSETESVRAQ